MQQPTLEAAAAQFRFVCSTIENAVQQAVAHRRKFKLAVSQFRQFTDHFMTIANKTMMTREQYEAYRFVVADAYKNYIELFKQNTLQSWASTALENPSSSVPSELCTLTQSLMEKTAVLDPVGSQFFNSTSSQWIQLHILDLRAIETSFQQFLITPNQDPTVIEFVNSRLCSINAFLNQYSQTEAAQSGLAVFSPIPLNYQNWRLKHSDLLYEKEIGSGISAVVYSGYYTPTNELVAIKKLKYEKLTGPQLQAFQRELSILATAVHPTILKFIGATDTPPFCVVTQYMPGGTLYYDIHQNHSLNPTDLTIALYDVARGMKFLHAQNIIHRDLKTLNVLIDADKRAKLSDFGFSKQIDSNQLMTMNVGTPHWMAPELLATNGPQTPGAQYDTKVDVYAYAIVMWEALAKEIPYHGMEPMQIVAQVMMNDLRPAVPRDAPAPFAELMRQCWARNPTMRPNFAEIVRKFKTLKIALPGCNMDVFAKYIKEHEDDQAAQQATESLQSCMSLMSSDPNRLEHFSTFVETIEQDGIPPDSVESCWIVLNERGRRGGQYFVRGLLAFIFTSRGVDAAKKLRTIDDIHPDQVSKILQLIPTGDEVVDEALVVASCKNGAAAQVLSLPLERDEIMLALEVIGRKGCPENYAKSVFSMCTKILQGQDNMLILSALRAIVGMGKVAEVPIDTIRYLIGSTDKSLRNAGFVTAAGMARKGVVMPTDIIDGIATKYSNNPFGTAVLVTACKSITCASHLTARLLHGGLVCPKEAMLQIIEAVSVHKELANQIAALRSLLVL